MTTNDPLEELMKQFEEVLAASGMEQKAQLVRMQQFREQAVEHMQALVDEANKDADK